MRTDNFLTLPFADPTDDSPLRSRWEACAGFSASGSGSQVCADCGWLAREHKSDTNVRRLPNTGAKAPRIRRLAS